MAKLEFRAILARARLNLPQFALIAALLSYVVLAIVVPRVDLADCGENARVAASIATGHGFSSPFPALTGPSALVPPVYPYILAGIFCVFGLFTSASYWVAVAFNILVHALSCILLNRAAGEAFGRRTGWYAAIALAGFPILFEPLVLAHILGGYMGQGLFIPPNSIWSTHLTELSIVLLIWLTLRRTHWAVYGISWGIASLINPGVLAMAPVFWGWQLWHSVNWRNWGLAAATAFLCITPWLIRNYEVFHRPVFIRDGFGIELNAGNRPGQKGLKSANSHPWTSEYELGRFVKMGELEYARISEKEAIASIRVAPGEFAFNSILRIGYYWLGPTPQSHRLGALQFVKYLPPLVFSLLAFYGLGLALWDRNRKALLFVSVLVLFPLVYYITHTSGSFLYQYPIQPEMMALAASIFFRKTSQDSLRHPEALEQMTGPDEESSAIQKSMPNLFVVNTPHQLLNAIEAAHALRLTNNHLLVVKPRNGVLDRFMPLIRADDWTSVSFPAVSIEPKTRVQNMFHPSVNRWYVRFVHFRKMYSLAKLAARFKHVDNLLLGHYSAEWTPFMRHIANTITYNTLYLLDDGTDTIEINETRRRFQSSGRRKEPIAKGTSQMSFREKTKEHLFGRWWKWNLAEAPRITFFTIYDLGVRPNDHVIKNDYKYLRSRAPQALTYMPDTVIFLGQCSVDDYIEINDHLKFLSNVRKYFADKRIIYVAHPRDSVSRVRQVMDHLQCELWSSSSAIECDLIVRGVKPAIVAGFISSALITLAHLMSAEVKIVCFHIAPEHWIHWREDAIGAYEYIKSKEEKRISVVPLSLQEDEFTTHLRRT